MTTATATCSHGVPKVYTCMRCIGAKGGQKLKTLYSTETRRQWGKLGGRPRGSKAKK